MLYVAAGGNYISFITAPCLILSQQDYRLLVGSNSSESAINKVRLSVNEIGSSDLSSYRSSINKEIMSLHYLL